MLTQVRLNKCRAVPLVPEPRLQKVCILDPADTLFHLLLVAVVFGLLRHKLLATYLQGEMRKHVSLIVAVCRLVVGISAEETPLPTGAPGNASFDYVGM